MMVCIGVVVRKGDRRQKAVLITVLRRQKAAREGPGSSNSLILQSKGHGGKYSGKAEQLIDDLDAIPSDLGRYATALTDYSNKRGLKPVYTVNELPRDPPRFSANLAIDGSTYEGAAKTKKQARHEAARKACLEMDIEV